MIAGKRGATPETVIMWGGVLLAAIILFTWGVKNFYPYYVASDKADHDLDNLYLKVLNACNAYYYKSKYNPVTEEGFLVINDTLACIHLKGFKRCRVLLCPTRTSVNLSLRSLTVVNVVKDENGQYFFTSE